MFAITVNNIELVPDRLRRLMGVVYIDNMDDEDLKVILGKKAGDYLPYRNLKHFTQWLQ